MTRYLEDVEDHLNLFLEEAAVVEVLMRRAFCRVPGSPFDLVSKVSKVGYDCEDDNRVSRDAQWGFVPLKVVPLGLGTLVTNPPAACKGHIRREPCGGTSWNLLGLHP